MREEIKKRIAQINAGTAPAGYKKTKVGIVPEEWKVIKINEIYMPVNEKNDGSFGVDKIISVANMYFSTKANVRSNDYMKSYNVCRLCDIVFEGNKSKYYSFGRFVANHIGDGIVSHVFLVFRPIIEGYILDYWKYAINYEPIMGRLLSRCTKKSTMMTDLVTKDFLNQLIALPPLPEQQKIAEILTAQDEVIALQEKRIETLKKQKIAFLQKMFPKKGCKKPEIRFAGFTDAWEHYHLGDLYIERNEKGNESLPILSVSIRSGVSDGELDTEALGKIVRRSEDKSTYKHVFSGDLVFNMMRAWQGAIGIAKCEGMVSPAYISAIPNEKVYPPFMNYLLRRKAIIDQINDLSYGVTDFRKRLYWKSFIRVSCQLPSVQEQMMITELFESLDALIDQHQRKLELEQQKKKALMQLLLSGKVRVESGE